MFEVLFGGRVFDVEVDGEEIPVVVVFEYVFSRNFPGSLVLFFALAPDKAAGKFLELNRLSFGVVLPPFGERLLVVPDLFGRAGTIEEEKVGGDAGVRREDAVGEADDGVEVELLEQFFLNARADAVAEECAVGNDDTGSARLRLTPEFAHNELEKEQGGFSRLFVFGKV